MRLRSIALCTILLTPMLTVPGIVAPAWAQVGGGGNSNTSTTVSTTTHTTFTDLPPVSQQVDTYSLQLVARMLGGPVLFDQLFTVPFGDPAFQSAIAAAQSVLAGNGATSFQGPTQQSTSTTLVDSFVTQVLALNRQEFSVTTTTTFGPNVILIGAEQSQTFFVAAGTTNINTNTHTESFVDRTETTTNTFLTTQVYELVGLTGGGEVPGGGNGETPPAAVPEPASLAVLAVGLGVTVLRRTWSGRQRPSSGRRGLRGDA